MSFEVLVLGALSGMRPSTSQAAVIALLRAPAATRTLLAFIVAGMVSSVLLGLVVIIAFKGAGSNIGHSTFSGVFDVIAGVAALGFAFGLAQDALPRRRERPRGRATSALAVRLQRPTIGTAAAAGVVTHVPGLIYFAALNSMAAEQPNAAVAAVQVSIYNVLWFAVPITAFAIAVRSPQVAAAALDRATAYARRNQTRLLIALFGAIGLYLTIKGIAALT